MHEMSLNVSVVLVGVLQGIVTIHRAFSLVILLTSLLVRERLQGKQEFFLWCYIKVTSFVHL